MTLRRTIPADVRPIISSALVISVAVGVFAVSFGVVAGREAIRAGSDSYLLLGLTVRAIHVW